MVQVPACNNVTVDPDSVQTVPELEAKLTASPELAVALTMKGAVPNTLPGSAPKVMLCGVMLVVTVKLWLTGVAAA